MRRYIYPVGDCIKEIEKILYTIDNAPTLELITDHKIVPMINQLATMDEIMVMLRDFLYGYYSKDNDIYDRLIQAFEVYMGHIYLFMYKYEISPEIIIERISEDSIYVLTPVVDTI